MSLFNEAKKNLSNIITYNATLDVIAKCNNPNVSLARALLKEAEDKGLANNKSYDIVLNVVANSTNPEIEIGLELLKVTQRKGLTNEYTLGSVLDIFAKCSPPELDKATPLIEQGIRDYGSVDMRKGDIIDLHGLSYGTVYFGLKKRFLKELDTPNCHAKLTLIYGKGLHARLKENEIHPLKQVVSRLIKEFATLGVSGEEERNSGRLSVFFQPTNQHLLCMPANHASSAVTKVPATQNAWTTRFTIRDKLSFNNHAFPKLNAKAPPFMSSNQSPKSSSPSGQDGAAATHCFFSSKLNSHAPVFTPCSPVREAKPSL